MHPRETDRQEGRRERQPETDKAAETGEVERERHMKHSRGGHSWKVEDRLMTENGREKDGERHGGGNTDTQRQSEIP